MNYGFTITTAGWNLLANLLAGETLELTRIMVGQGRVPEGINPADLDELVAPIAQATSTVPIVVGKNISFVVEYRSDMNGGLDEGFWLNEFGVFALDKNQDEVLLYYATLGDYPQYVSPTSTGGVDIRRFPVSITLTDELDIIISYPALAFMTSEDVEEFFLVTAIPRYTEVAQGIVDVHNVSPVSHPDLRNVDTQLASRIQRIEDMIVNGVTGNPYIIRFDDLDGLTVTGVWNTVNERIEF